MKAAHHLFDRMRENNPDVKEPNWQAWAKDFDLIFRCDHRTEESVERTIDGSQRHVFWHKNILSAAKLREKFDRLALDLKPNGNGKHQAGMTSERATEITQGMDPEWNR